MQQMKFTPATVDEYIASFPEDVQEKLQQIRGIIRQHAPEAIEALAYGMPGYKLNKKPLVYFGGFEKHIGFYATPTGHEAFKKELSSYKQGKGSVQFPLNQSLPLELIAEMVKFRVLEEMGR
ncbi:MAG TPA: DUF1801 domain-containing protein [Bacteroidales bacterium]|nr:DUF1801 domain-containing protein [Bacteroidales bacterium]